MKLISKTTVLILALFAILSSPTIHCNDDEFSEMSANGKVVDENTAMIKPTPPFVGNGDEPPIDVSNKQYNYVPRY